MVWAGEGDDLVSQETVVRELEKDGFFRNDPKSGFCAEFRRRFENSGELDHRNKPLYRRRTVVHEADEVPEPIPIAATG